LAEGQAVKFYFENHAVQKNKKGKAGSMLSLPPLRRKSNKKFS
jgi:hypothetical protein